MTAVFNRFVNEYLFPVHINHVHVESQYVMGLHRSTLVARGANTQLDPCCVSAPPATNVDLFACFAERLCKSSSISYLPCRRVASDSLCVGMPYAWSIDRTACRMFNR